MRRLALFSIALCVAATPAFADNAIASKIASLTDTADYAHSRWGILVIDHNTSDVLIARNSDQFFLPASTTKLYSCSAAMCILGPEHRFQTPVFRRGNIEHGTLRGDLIVRASGDLTFGGRTLSDGTMAFTNKDHTYSDPTSRDAAVTPTDPLAGLRELARQVKGAGINCVAGDVLIDDRLFDHGQGSGSGPRLITPIIVNDNVLDVIVAPGERAGTAAHVTLRPETDTFQVDAQVKTVPETGPANVTVSRVGPRRVVVRGSIPEKSKPLVRIHPIDDPAAFARSLFIECLRRAEVEVPASPLSDAAGELPNRDAYDRLERVAEFTSPPLKEAIKVTLKVSHNLYASTLPYLIALKHGERTLAAGLRRQGQFLRDLGIDTNAISFAGGAGGMNADSTTPRATVQLVSTLMKRPEWPAIEAGLPILGVDGTLAGMVPRSSPAYGRVFAKTGTLWWEDVLNSRALVRSKALAGTMTTPRGRKLVFAIFVNDVPLPRGITPTREGELLGKICEVIYLNADDSQ